MRADRARPRAAAVALTAAFAVLTAAAPAEAAKGVLHKVGRDGESYAEIAERYYDQRYLGLHLRAVNRHPEPLSRGRTLVIPTARSRKLGRGESLEAFAARHLSQARRADYLRRLHRLGRRAPKPGARLLVPPSLRHLVRAKETLRGIARTYYRDTSGRRLELLRAYNGLRDNAVRKGQVLRLPLDTDTFAHARVLARKKRPLAPAASTPAPPPRSAPVAAAPPPPPSSPPQRVRARPRRAGRDPKRRAARLALEDAERLYREGRYAEAHATAARTLDVVRPSGAPAVSLWRVAGASLVALGRLEEARAAFTQLLGLDPSYRVAPRRTSPKIIEVFEAARRGR